MLLGVQIAFIVFFATIRPPISGTDKVIPLENMPQKCLEIYPIAASQKGSHVK